MQQYGNNGRPYDQNRDSLRSSGSSQRTTPPNDGASDTSRYGFNGEPLSRPPARLTFWAMCLLKRSPSMFSSVNSIPL